MKSNVYNNDTMNNSFGNILREWRKQKRYSQLQLALELGISSKHICFLETGRSIPSKEMIIKIGTFLFLSKREINRAIHAAGYAPAYTELPYEHGDFKCILSAIDHMLMNHMPYPAIVLNQDWDIVKSNGSAQKLLSTLGFSEHKNLVEAIIHDDPATSKIINWHESALAILVRLRQEISIIGHSERLVEFEQKLASRLKPKSNFIDTDRSVLSVTLQLPDHKISLFSIIAQLSTVQDVAISEFKIELMFPADTETTHYFDKESVQPS